MTIEELLATEGKYVGPVKGFSMLPMLVAERDSVVIYAEKGPYKPLDVVLYKRGEDYVLHRIVRVLDGEYIIRGDNCYYDERVKKQQILGVLREFFHGENHIFCDNENYLKYAKKRVRNYFLRKAGYKLKGFAKKVLRIPYKMVKRLTKKGEL
jgi:hypothetical protein